MKSILEFLQATADARPSHPAVIEESGVCTYGELLACSRRTGSALAARIVPRTPVPVLLDKGRRSLYAFFGVVYAGGFYVPLNPDLPAPRLCKMLDVLRAPYLITEQRLLPLARRLFPTHAVLCIEDLLQTPANDALLARVQADMSDADPLYCMFTSGSTGTPKGVLIRHHSVLKFIPSFTSLFGIGADDIIGNQAPFDFDVSVKDIYAAVYTGATLVLIPRRLFSQPAALIDFLCTHSVTSLTWAASALGLVSALHGLDYRVPDRVRRVLFSGETLPPVHLHRWMQALPQADFVNLYGPTEITCNCAYHRVERSRNYPQGLPLGRAFPHARVFLLDENGQEIVHPEQRGEICVSGDGLALGYLHAPAQTARVFVQHPTCPGERIYRTGDIGRYGDGGELYFCGRRDHQIKRMGHRIELEEIEQAAALQAGVSQCCCVFDAHKNRLYGFYTGPAGAEAVLKGMRDLLPACMVPGTLTQLEQLPLTPRGKADRAHLLRMAGGEAS